MKPSKKNDAKEQYLSPKIKRYKIAELATSWDMEVMGAISPCGICDICGSTCAE